MPCGLLPMNAALQGPTPIDTLARVLTPNRVTSPISGRGAAFVRIEVLSRVGAELTSLGVVVLGDLLALELDSGVRVQLPVRRAELRRLSDSPEPEPIERLAAELVPLLTRAARGGVLCQREHLVFEGDRLRLRAVVEAGFVRDDLGPILLDEVLA